MSSPICHTVNYKTVKGNAGEDIAIPLDVYFPSTALFDTPPVPLIWIHTGGFLQGTRKFAPGHFLRSVNKHNFALITPDFRLAPQVDLTNILEDIHDCIHFVLNGKLSNEVESSPLLDTSQYVLAGSSAGGWSSLLLGLNLIPSLSIPTPTALISIYPISTVNRSLAPYFYTPLKPLPWAYSPNAKKGDIVPSEQLGEHLNKQGKVRIEAPPAAEPARATLYNYARQEGIYPSLILNQGGGGGKEQEGETYCVPSLIKKKFVGQEATQTSSPPKLIFITYGDADIMVETSQSDMVIDALKQTKINVKTHIEPGKSHVWDILEADAEIEGLWDSVSEAVHTTPRLEMSK